MPNQSASQETQKPATQKPAIHLAATQQAVTLPATMRAAVARRYGSPDIVEVEAVPMPPISAGRVLIRIEASSLNALDWHFLTGTPYFLRLVAGLRRPKGIIRGADVAGTIVAVGDDVAGFAVGDRVFGECSGGGFAEYASVRAGATDGRLVKIPDGVSFEAAGATAVAGLTALQGLRTHGAVQPGDQVLINGAAGGVGTFAVQIAVALGAEVTAVCSTRNVEMVRALGAHQVIDYVSDDFVLRGDQFDVMLDNVGNRSASECLSVMKNDGRYVAVSGPKDNPWLDPMVHVARVALKFWRADPSFHQFTANANHDDLTFLGELLANGQLTPEIQRVVGLDDVAVGLAEIGTGHARAKIVVKPH